MKKEIVISESNDLAVVFEDNRAAEFVIRSGEQLVGDIILGKVESVVPAIEAAFVNIGHEKNGFIHVADLPIPQRGKKNKPPQIKSGDKLIVQIAKAPTGTKGARLTGRISVPGRYLVFVPHDNRVCISRRITDSKERERLRRIAFTLKDPGHGLIVRTEAIGASEEELRRDIDELIERWAEILHEAQVRHSPALLYRDQDLLTRVLRDWLTADTERVILEDQEAFTRSKELLSDWMPDMVKNLYLHKAKDGVMQHYKVHAELENALKPTIRLPSGGSIVIEPTEALTVIDVNSGKLTQSKSLQDTVLRTNIEAATEIARQLRLRDIGGVIIIDFISMDHASDRKKVIAHLEEALKPDKSRPQITSQFSEHGLLEVARRRQGQSLTEQLTRPCPSCHGYGRVRNEVYSAAPTAAPIEVSPLDEPELIVDDLIEEPTAGPDMRDAEPEPGREGRGARGRSRGATPRHVTPVLVGADDGESESDLLDEGGEGSGEASEDGEGARRRRRRRRRRGRGDRAVAEGSGTAAVAAVGSIEPYADGDVEDFEEVEEMRVPSAEEGDGAFGDDETRRRRRRRRRGGRGRRGEGERPEGAG
ncbi:MAG: Rne/Rng family ribonuclease, partial [Candidatus Sericytochromatia bacterium]|nr:Rne/Rng family ribonuclease [Candidatus Tanganyikabacteria bacterium]